MAARGRTTRRGEQRTGPGLLRRIGVAWCIGAASIFVVVAAIPGIHARWAFFDFFAIAVVWGVVDALLGTILRIVTLPLRVLTLGLFTIVVNGIVLVVTAWISPRLSIDGFGAALLGALLLGIVNFVGHLIVFHRSNSGAR